MALGSSITQVTESGIKPGITWPSFVSSGIATATNFKTGTTDVHDVGVTAATVVVGSAVTGNSTGLDVTGIVTATSFVGDGSSLIGVASTEYIHSSTNAVLSGIVTTGPLNSSTGNFSSNVTISGNLGVAGTITYEDVARVDATGISTFREGFGVGPLAGIALTAYKDGSIRTSGIVTASSFSGSIASSNIDSGTVATARLGSGTANSSSFLRGDSSWAAVTSTTINNNADNRVITGSGTANTLEGESALTFDGTILTTSTDVKITGASGNTRLYFNRTNAAGSNGNQFGRLIFNDNNANQVAGIEAIRSSAVDDADITLKTRPTGGTITERVRINSLGHVLIGYDSDLSGGDNSQKLQVSHTGGGFIRLLRDDTSISDNNNIGGIRFGGRDGGGNQDLALILCTADGDQDTDDHPGKLQFFTTPDGSGSTQERMRIDNAGHVCMGPTNTMGNLSSNDAPVVINSYTDGGQGALYIHCDGQGGGSSSAHYGIKIDAHSCANNADQYGMMIDCNQQLVSDTTGIFCDVYGSYQTTYCFRAHLQKQIGAYTTGTSFHSKITETSAGGASYHFRGYDGGSERIKIEKDGDIKNTNNSYGSLSDVKLKENIEDAGSQWNDIKSIRVRNFNFINDPDKVKMLGVVAQEVESISAGLIDTENDVTIDEESGVGSVTGTTKYVKYSILYMKAVKALQEAMTRIETLEAKVATLEGS